MRKSSILYLLTGFILTLGVLSFFSWMSYQRLNAMISYSDQVEKTFRIMNAMEGLSRVVADAETSVRGYVITGDSIYLEPLKRAQLEMPHLIDTLRELVKDNTVQKSRLGLVRNAAILRIQLLENSIALVDNGVFDSVKTSHMMKGRSHMASFHLGIQQMMEQEQQMLQESYQQKNFYQSIAPPMFKRVFLLVGIVFLVLLVLLVREFLQRLRFQHELQVQLMALHQSNAELTQLAFAASHDLQEPVRKIRTFLDRLIIKQRDLLNEDGRHMINRIDHSARRLQGMLEDVSNYMNLIDSDEEKVPVSMIRLLEEVREGLKEQITEKKATLHIGQLPEMKAYPQQVRILFRALLDNALKYSKPGMAPVIDIIATEREGSRLGEAIPHLDKTYDVVMVKDNGIGFDNEFREKIFHLFRRLHTQEKFGGKGIGLATCQRVMANHNGFILADAKPGEGASFTLFFPRD